MYQTYQVAAVEEPTVNREALLQAVIAGGATFLATLCLTVVGSSAAQSLFVAPAAPVMAPAYYGQVSCYQYLGCRVQSSCTPDMSTVVVPLSRLSTGCM